MLPPEIGIFGSTGSDEVWTFLRAKTHGMIRRAWLLGVERGPPARRGLAPEGAEELSPGLNGAKIRRFWDVLLPRSREKNLARV
jgi:hypothetical protein